MTTRQKLEQAVESAIDTLNAFDGDAGAETKPPSLTGIAKTGKPLVLVGGAG